MIIRKRPTLRMIAEELGVTITTVSCILSNKGGTYAESTRQKVFEVANRLKYRPNALANGMRGGKTHSAGVMIRNRGHYLSSIVNAIHDTLLERDTVMFLAWNKWLRFEEGWSSDTERQVIHNLLDRRVDGFIIVPTSEEFDRFYFEEITERHIPIVLVDRELKASKLIMSALTTLWVEPLPGGICWSSGTAGFCIAESRLVPIRMSGGNHFSKHSKALLMFRKRHWISLQMTFETG